MSELDIPKNTLIHEELNYDRDILLTEAEDLKNGLNTKQALAFNEISRSVEQNDGRLFFVYGSGGIGKTYLWRTLIASLRSQGKIVLAVASSGIASLLLPGGRTPHSRFKIPLKLNETSCCNLFKKTDLAELLCKVYLIIWDEAPMMHMNALEAVQRALADLMMEENNDKKLLFGKKTLVLEGDFRQILPVIEEGTREDIVNASISKSKFWKYFIVFELTENMRLSTGDTSQEKKDEMEEFAKWILDVGNGKAPAISLDEFEHKDWIQIPSDLLIDCKENHIHIIVETMYPDFLKRMLEKEYLAERSILAPTNECVHKINSHVLSSVPGK
ncbi:ATP-dependent DNA helicase PIF4-like [Papaver somniferum]|uniref:ATP-dependent DNA helicase PIF4-like n=1 Tax=Papaver somniferum TaxID=3469 RepID=UPI000E6F5BE0|nr:ATP-dependent DNA helicase PIF4-like [Papaver somniferum]